MKLSLIALTLAAALPLSAMAADGVKYNYVEGGYAKLNTDGGDADGWALKGSGAIAPSFHVFGSYGQKDIDHTNITLKEGNVGIGYNRAIAQNTDFVSKVAYEGAKAGRYDQNGYSIEAGLNSRLSPRFSGQAAVGYQDGKDVDGEVYGKLGGQIHMTQNWSVSGDVKFADGAQSYFIGPRYTF